MLLCPVGPTAALKHDHSEPMVGRNMLVNGEERSYLETSYWSNLIIISDLPSTVVPIGFLKSSLLPVGIQIVAPFLQDLTSIEVGKMLENLHSKCRCEAPPGSKHRQ